MTDEEQLAAAVSKAIDDNNTKDEISPAWIATQVMLAIEFPRELHRLGYAGCHLELRQIARQKLRGRFDPNKQIQDSVDGEDDLFPSTLQDRYPRKQTEGDPVYVLRRLMTAEDVAFNVARMRRGGEALLKHADALEAWDTNRGAA